MKILQPADWASPTGYANGIAARGELVFVAGQIGWNAAQELESTDLVAQARQALANIVAVLAEAGARPEHLVRMTWYVIDKREYRDAYGKLGAVMALFITLPYGKFVHAAYRFAALVRYHLERKRALPEIGAE